MGESKIEWTNATWNPVRGCSLVSEGCRNCYAMRQAHRQKNGAYKGLTRLGPHGPVWTGDVRLVPEVLDYPLKLKKPHLIFVNSMSDLFHESLTDDNIAAVFSRMWAADHHTYQILTKRPERMRQWATKYDRKLLAAGRRPLSQWRHVWLGVSVESDDQRDRIADLVLTPAAVRWVSLEPLLGPMWLDTWLTPRQALSLKWWQAETGEKVPSWWAENKPLLDWVVVGAESGAGHRPMDFDWVRSLRDQCAAVGVPFFFKQAIINGKKIGLPFLDGVQHAKFPVSQPFSTLSQTA